MISIVIPVRNGGEDLQRCLAAIGSQDLDDAVEVIVVDSGSTDGSVEIARNHGARVEEIGHESFNHGGTRNLGAELAQGDVLVFISQDAHPESSQWLETLTGPLRAGDDGIAGVYGRQTPNEHANPPERFFLDFLYGPAPREQMLSPGDRKVSMHTTLFSNANSAIRRDVFDRFKFADDIIMSEDQEWSRRVLLAGYRLRYEPRAAVTHSHPYTIGQAFRRFFDSGVSAERAYLAGGASSSVALWRTAARYGVEEIKWLRRSGNARWIPYACIYEMAKFVGLQLGTRHRWLPRWLKKRCSQSPAYWDYPQSA
jgi:rhamnosyltransferase